MQRLGEIETSINYNLLCLTLTLFGKHLMLKMASEDCRVVINYLTTGQQTLLAIR